MKRMLDPTTLGKFSFVESQMFANGYANFSGKALGDGLYLITYANCSVLLPLTQSMIDVSALVKIRVAMPVIYDAEGSARPGILGISFTTDPDTFILALFDSQGNPVVDGLTISIYKAVAL